MSIGREVSTRKNRSVGSPAAPLWLLQSGGLSSRLHISRAEKELLDLIRKHGELTKGDLVSYTEYSRTKITSSTLSLLHRQYIIENPNTEYSGGRRSKTFSLNGNLGYLAGVAVGATSIRLAVADFAQRIIAQRQEPAAVREGPDKILNRVCGLLEQMMIEHGLDSSRLYGIGIGVPGPVDFSRGILVSPPIMPGWDRFPIIETIQQWFPAAKVVVDNDVNVMAIGEVAQGAGTAVDNLIFVKIGTGIGAGIISKGQIYRGSDGCAGDIGHISVDKNGPICHCGNRGCLEAMAGGAAIAERAVSAALAGSSPLLLKLYERNGGSLTAVDVGTAAREGDPASLEIIRTSGQMIGDVLASLVNFYDPDLIVIGGGVSKLGNLLLSSIRQAVLNRSLPLATCNLRIIFSEIEDNTGVIGAVNLAMDHIFAIEPGSGSGE